MNLPPREDAVNLFDLEAAARQKLAGPVFAAIAGGDRAALERIIFRPRVLVNARGLDLTAELFGQQMFTPILAGPSSRQERVHPEGEVAAARGAAAAKTVLLVSSRSSRPLEQIAVEAKAGLWFQIHPEPDAASARNRVQQAVKLGCRAICLTTSGEVLDWAWIDQVRQGLTAPFLLKGVMSPEEARAAVAKGVDGIVVSNGGRRSPGLAAPIEMLPSVVDAAGGKVPVLIDGGFRRGTDVLKALAFGARAVLVARPVLWGLAAYGAEGVQTALEMLQTELARSMAMAGTPNLKSIDRKIVKISTR
jgi:4-hydroxymandelate oxidase